MSSRSDEANQASPTSGTVQIDPVYCPHSSE
jgi:hypothetical protein